MGSKYLLRKINFGHLRIPSFEEPNILGKRSFFQSLIARDNPKQVRQRNSGIPSFTFLVHPRDPFDALECAKIDKYGLGFMGKIFPGKLEQELKNRFLYNNLATIPPFIIRNSDITIEGKNVRGNLIAVLLYGEQMLLNSWMGFAKKRIVEAIQLAQESGSTLIGLGAHTSPATLGGLTLRKKGLNVDVDSISDIGITNGNSLTAGMSYLAVKRAVRTLGLSPASVKIGIVGASGSVGSATSRLLTDDCFVPILYGRSMAKLETKFRDIRHSAIFTDELKDMRNCDVIVVMTSASTSTLLPEHVSPGTIIIEDTQPRNISGHHAMVIRKGGSVVIDGGFVHIPGYKCDFNLRIPPETTLACLAETMLLALEGHKSDFSIGDTEVSKARKMLMVAERHNASIAPPTWNSVRIDDGVFHNVRLLNRNKRRHSSSSLSV